MKKLLITTLLIGAVAGSAMGQGLISLQGKAFYNTASGATTGTAIPIGTVAQVGTFGNLNVAVIWSDTASSGLFGATTASSLTAAWNQASPIDQRISAPGGTLIATTVTVGASNPGEVFVVGWTGTYTTWNAAFDAANNPATAASVLLGWSGRNGVGSLGWSQGNALPPSTPVTINSGAAGFNGLILQPYGVIPEPTSFALAGLGLASLLILRRRNK